MRLGGWPLRVEVARPKDTVYPNRPSGEESRLLVALSAGGCRARHRPDAYSTFACSTGGFMVFTSSAWTTRRSS